MKKLLSLFSVVALFATTALAQDTNTAPIQSTNQTPTIQGGLQELVDAFKDQTNWFFETHGLYAPALEHKYGGGIGAFYPMSQYLLFGARLDYVDGGFWMPSGNATIQVPIKVTSWLQVTPLAYAGMGIPVSGAKVGNFNIPGHVHDNNGQVTAITGEGFAVKLWDRGTTPTTKWYQFQKLDLVADRENWTGFKGVQYRLGLVINKSFGGLKK